jgi:hypothetical protein
LALPAPADAADGLLLTRGRPFMKRIAIVWLVESLFGSPRRRADWTLLMVFAGIAIALLMLALRWAR